MAEHVAESNFLLPNGTFIAELIVFVLILAVLWKWVVPVVQKGMRQRQEMIESQVREAEETKAKLAEADDAYKKALNDARVEAAQIRENARAEAQHNVDEMRSAAQAEQGRIVARGEEQLATQRASVVRELRGEVGSLAVQLSEKIVGQKLAGDGQVSRTVDEFISGLEQSDGAQPANAADPAGSGSHA